MTDALRAAALIVATEANRLDRGWDYQGVHAAVRTALDEDGRTLADVVLAGIAAARDPKAHTPAAMRWSVRYAATSTAGPREPKCTACGRTRPAHDAAEAKLPADVRHAWGEA